MGHAIVKPPVSGIRAIDLSAAGRPAAAHGARRDAAGFPVARL